jgi:hypothetical protein
MASRISSRFGTLCFTMIIDDSLTLTAVAFPCRPSSATSFWSEWNHEPPITTGLWSNVMFSQSESRQFCYLYQKDKILPINYTINIDEEISTWYNRLEQSIMSPDPPLIGPTTDHSLQDDEETNASSIHSLEKDTHIVNTLLKNCEVGK